MMRFAAIAALCAASVATAHAQGTLYGVATFSSFGVQSLYSINPSTGAATLVGSTGLRQIAGLDWDSANSRLVALNGAGDQFEINTATGASTLIVDASFGVPEGSIAIANGSAFTTLLDNLNSWNGAAWQQVGPSLLAPGADISGLDFGGTMLLGLATNGANPDQLVSFNVSTGAATVIGATGTNAGSVAGLAHAFLGGAWYMTDGSTLFSLDSATGAATQIGAHGVTGFSGLAFVPTPGAAILLGLGGLVVARRRR
jgi:hypothetical protein